MALCIWLRLSIGIAAKCWPGRFQIPWMSVFAWTVWLMRSINMAHQKFLIRIRVRSLPVPFGLLYYRNTVVKLVWMVVAVHWTIFLLNDYGGASNTRTVSYTHLRAHETDSYL